MRRHAGLDIIIIGVIIAVMLNYYICESVFSSCIAGYFRGVYISRISLFSTRLYFANFARAQPILEIKILNVEEARSVSPFVKLLFANKKLNWLFAKYKRLENNPLYAISLSSFSSFSIACLNISAMQTGYTERGEGEWVNTMS